MRRKNSLAAGAFTLVELLVVILIIGLLVSILLPVLWKVHRRAMAVAAKIAYVDDDNLCVADTNGSKKLRLVGSEDGGKYHIGNFGNTPILWSPDGLKIAAPCQTRTEIVVVDVGSGKWKTFAPPQGYGFHGWIAKDRITSTDSQNPNILMVLDADSGEKVGVMTLPFPSNTFWTALVRTPPCCRRGSWISMYGKDSGGYGDGIAFLKKDFSLGKRVWEEPVAGKRYHLHPRVDPFGEWVAWTAQESGKSSVAIKPVEAPSSEPPELLVTDFYSVLFCDWTDDAKLLCNAMKVPPANSGGKEVWGLVLLDRAGKLVRDLNIKCRSGAAAAWRRYEHQ